MEAYSGCPTGKLISKENLGTGRGNYHFVAFVSKHPDTPIIMKNSADPAFPQSMRVRFPVRGMRNHVIILLQIANAIPISTSIPVDEDGRPADIKKYGPFP